MVSNCGVLIKTAAIGFACAVLAAAQTPRLQIVSKKDIPVYHVGERIEITAYFSAETSGMCYVESQSQRLRKDSLDQFRVVALRDESAVGTQVPDPFFDEWDYDPSPQNLFGLFSVLKLTEKARSLNFDVNEWARFVTPGRYLIRLQSRRPQRCVEDVADAEQVSVLSNEIEVTIIPGTPEWLGAEFDKIQRELKSSGESRHQALAARRLTYIDTPKSVKLMAQHYVAAKSGAVRYILGKGLLQSLHRDEAITELEQVMRGKGKRDAESPVRVMALLILARECGEQALPDISDAPKHRQVLDERGRRYDEIFADLRSRR